MTVSEPTGIDFGSFPYLFTPNLVECATFPMEFDEKAQLMGALGASIYAFKKSLNK